MSIVYLVTIVLMLALQNVTKKGYTQKNVGGVCTFSIMTCLAAALFFVVASGGLVWEPKLIPYSLAFATAYCTATVFSIFAIECGSLSLTNLLISYSLLIPAIYGIFALDEIPGILFYPGIVLLVISLFLINEQGEKAAVRFKWIIYVTLAAVANGLCSVFQTMQQKAFHEQYKSEFMIIALVAGAVGLGIYALFSERKEIITSVKNGWVYAGATGIANGMVNLFVMLLLGKMAASLMFPSISAGGIAVTYLISKYGYKEELTRKQLIGFLCGIASVILLNI